MSLYSGETLQWTRGGKRSGRLDTETTDYVTKRGRAGEERVREREQLFVELCIRISL